MSRPLLVTSPQPVAASLSMTSATEETVRGRRRLAAEDDDENDDAEDDEVTPIEFIGKRQRNTPTVYTIIHIR